MTAAPTEAVILSGKDGSFQVSLLPADGFSGTMALSCTSLPVFANCTMPPSAATLSDGSAVAEAENSLVTCAGTATAGPWPCRQWLFIACSLLGLADMWLRRRRAIWIAVVAALALVTVASGGVPPNASTTVAWTR
ncbi:MAG TPA: hypothetical protein VNF74_04510 [Terriglobales bacterium]|nr:hypothetical protein [Terriglobales bacterium]